MAKAWRGFLGLGAAAGLALVLWWSLDAYRARHAPRVLLLTPAVEGLSPSRALGLGRLIRDEWEVASASTVLAPPPGTLPADLPPGDVLVRLSARTEGDTVSLRVAWADAAASKSDAAWREVETPMLPPAEALLRIEEAGPLRSSHRGATSLFPSDPRLFWALVDSTSVQDDVEADKGLDASRRIAEAVPASAAAWTNYGEHIYRSLWTQPAGGDLPQSQALEAFDRALALVPGYPRAALLEGMLLTDIGSQRDALRVLVDARALRPQVPDLYSGLAYAGRTGGLLEGAARAVEARERLVRPLRLPLEWFTENTFLYSGRWDAFRESLQGSHDPVFLFYDGYLELAQGRADQALPYFKEGAANRRTSIPFSDLCGVYAEALGGRKESALARLRAFEDARGRLRIPDGELTFKVAEAYAFLGRPDEALAAAGRAFAQGFGCLAWYERSPLFALVRQGPKWASLRQHILERQNLLQASFPPETFG